MEVEAHRTNPIRVYNIRLVPFERTLECNEDVRVFRIRGQHCGNLEQMTQLVDLRDVFQGELGHRNATMRVAPEQTLERQNSRGLSNGVPRNAQRGTHGNFL